MYNWLNQLCLLANLMKISMTSWIILKRLLTNDLFSRCCNTTYSKVNSIDVFNTTAWYQRCRCLVTTSGFAYVCVCLSPAPYFTSGELNIHITIRTFSGAWPHVSKSFKVRLRLAFTQSAINGTAIRRSLFPVLQIAHIHSSSHRNFSSLVEQALNLFKG